MKICAVLAYSSIDTCPVLANLNNETCAVSPTDASVAKTSPTRSQVVRRHPELEAKSLVLDDHVLEPQPGKTAPQTANRLPRQDLGAAAIVAEQPNRHDKAVQFGEARALAKLGNQLPKAARLSAVERGARAAGLDRGASRIVDDSPTGPRGLADIHDVS